MLNSRFAATVTTVTTGSARTVAFCIGAGNAGCEIAACHIPLTVVKGQIEYYLHRCSSLAFIIHKRKHNFQPQSSPILLIMDSLWPAIGSFICALFVLEKGADGFVDNAATLGKSLGISEVLIGLLTAGAEWEEVNHFFIHFATLRASTSPRPFCYSV